MAHCGVTDYEDDNGPHSCTRPDVHVREHACGCGYRWGWVIGTTPQEKQMSESGEPPPCTCIYGRLEKVDPNCVYHGSNWVRVR
jgi:hypothetical protein